MDISDYKYSIEIVGALAIGLIGIALGLRRFFKSWTVDGAETEVVQMLRAEITRMHDQNLVISKELNKLQLDIILLNKELHTLTLENLKLHTEVNILTEQIDHLRKVLTDDDGHLVCSLLLKDHKEDNS